MSKKIKFLFSIVFMFRGFSVKDLEGYLKTDDRMRLAKERREEREKSLGKCSCFCMCGCNKISDS